MSRKQLSLALISLMGFLPACYGSKGQVGSHESLSIEIGNLSPIEVGVLTPSKKFIFLRTDEIKCQGLSINGKTVLIDPSASMGYYWDSNGKESIVPVFAEQGVFTIYVSDNLETEFENSSAISKTYLNKQSSKRPVSSNSCSRYVAG